MSTREAFEKWATKHNFSTRAEAAEGHIYWNPSTQQLWEAWQAAVEAEREACAQIADNAVVRAYDLTVNLTIAAAIRAREDKKA